MNKRLKKNLNNTIVFATCLTLCSPDTSAQSQGYRQLEGSYNLNAETNAKSLYSALSNNLQTSLSIETPLGTKNFTIKPSSAIASGNAGVFYYEGLSKENPSEALLIMLEQGSFQVHYQDHNTGSQYTLAKNELIAEATFKKVIDEKILPAADPKLRQLASDLIIKIPGATYSWVNSTAVKTFMNTYITEGQQPDKYCSVSNTLTQPAGPEVQQKPTEGIGTGGAVYSRWGYIGKRDVFVYLYNYNNQVPAYDIGQNIAAINFSISSFSQFSDNRSANIRLVITQNPINIAITGLAWDDDSEEFRNNFKTYIQNHNLPQTILPAAIYSYHILLTGNFWDDDIMGIADGIGSNYAVSVAFNTKRQYATPAHELGHCLGAEHVAGCSYLENGTGYNDLMSAGGQQGNCNYKHMHTNAGNRNNIDTRVSNVALLDEVPPYVTSALPAIANANLSQDLFEQAYNTANQVVYGPENPWGNWLINEQPLFDQHSNFGSALASLGGYKLAVYKVKFPASAYYQLKIISADYDTYLYLLDKNGNLVAKDDDGVSGTYRSYISGTFNNDWYYIIVGGFNNAGGTSTLKVRYGWFQGGVWKGNPEGSGDAMKLDRGDGNIVFSADFGLNDKGAALSVNDGPSRNPADEIMEVYPNPVTGDDFTIATTTDHPKQYGLYDIMGKLIFTGSFHNRTEKVTLNRSVANGQYVLRINDLSTGKRETQRILLNRK